MSAPSGDQFDPFHDKIRGDYVDASARVTFWRKVPDRLIGIWVGGLVIAVAWMLTWGIISNIFGYNQIWCFALYAFNFLFAATAIPLARLRLKYVRNAFARIMFDAAFDGSLADFVLYLPPFNLDGRELFTGETYTSTDGEIMPYRIKVDETIEDAVQPFGQLLSVGLKNNLSTGTVRHLRGDPNWSAKIETLMRKARLVFVVPGTSSGVSTELDLIKSLGLSDKCVYLFHGLENNQKDEAFEGLLDSPAYAAEHSLIAKAHRCTGLSDIALHLDLSTFFACSHLLRMWLLSHFPDRRRRLS